MATGLQSIIEGEETYFAFVESIDELGADVGGNEEQHLLAQMLSARRDRRLLAPTHAIWVDCVKKDYFLQLAWRNDPCEIGDRYAARERKRQLDQLDVNAFAVVLLLVSRQDETESGLIGEFGAAAWHEIVVSPGFGMPGLMGGDFDAALDVERTRVRYVRHAHRCDEDDRRSLLNVFNLNFLPDVGTDERGAPEPTELPPLLPLQG